MSERDHRGRSVADFPGHGMRERLAVYGFFIIMGIGTSAWISRLPTVKASLGLQPSGLALMTILGGCGALVGMLISGVLTDRLGVRRAMLLAASTWCLGMIIAALAVTLCSVPGVVLGLLFNSAGISLWGTVNTVEAGAVERFSSRSIMPRFHASYSLGMFLALGLGSLLSHLGVAIGAHLAVNALVSLALVIACVLLCPAQPLGDYKGGADDQRSDQQAGSESKQSSAFGKQLAAWGDALVLMLALINVALEASEGAVNDWTGIGLVDAFGVPESQAGLAPTIFAAAMIVSRLLGTHLIERLGNMRSLVLTLLVSALGILVYALAPSFVLSLVGTGIWGVGAALGVPIVTTLATKDPAVAAQRASVISTAYYGVSWIIPPAIGFLADHTGVRPALLPLAFLLAAVTLMVPTVSRLTRE
ncbi:sugar MFS transporter [Bifidobacterium sp. A11]|uniref:MFS transporter n=1 Tax=Bifidobacterium sp. A11 TaxID=1394176 RepID=UPI000464B8FA|nr:MFS transporter [Bifidobacterium sp. A11]